MVFQAGHSLLEHGEPMGGNLCQDEALAGDAIGEDDVVGRDAIGGSEEQGLVVEAKEVADLACGELLQGLQGDGGDGFGGRHGGFSFCE